jgi:hypothetical protein
MIFAETRLCYSVEAKSLSAKRVDITLEKRGTCPQAIGPSLIRGDAVMESSTVLEIRSYSELDLRLSNANGPPAIIEGLREFT